MRIPIEIVVYRMIDPAAIFATKADIERRNAEVLQEARIVRARAERLDSQVGPAPQFLALLRGIGVPDALELIPPPGRKTGLGVLNVAYHAVYKLLQAV